MSSISIAQPQVAIDEAIKELLKVQPETCTIVHCRIYMEQPTDVRIWPGTFLIEEDETRRKLIKPFNISLMPHWTHHVIYNGFIHFTLVFEGLGKNCKTFYLLEDIPEPGGFYSEQITRNSSDVYQAEVWS